MCKLQESDTISIPTTISQSFNKASQQENTMKKLHL